MISIITPVYNTEKYLADAVRSILAQTYTDIELILVNDGSTDGSGALCDELARGDRRIKVVHKENGGVASARNAGLDASMGDYIGWVDSDDLIHPKMYEIMIKLAQEYEADIVQCSHTRNVEIMSKCNIAQIYDVQVLDNICGLKRMYQSHYTNSFCLWSKIYRRDLFNNVRFTEGAAFEDDEIVPVLIERAGVLVYFDLPLYCYIKREGSIITAPRQENIMAFMHHIETRMLRFEHIDKDLYGFGLKHFFQQTKNQMCNKLFFETPVQEQAVQLLKKHRKRIWNIANKCDKIALVLVFMGMKNYVAKHDFEPVQALIARFNLKKKKR